MTTPHGNLVKAVLEYLDLCQVRAWSNNTGAYKRGKGYVSYGLVGSGDILGIIPGSGKFLSIECKTGSGRPTPAQQHFRYCVINNGGCAIVARSLGDVHDALVSHGVPNLVKV